MTIVGICAVGGAGIFKILGPDDLSTFAIAAVLGAAGIGVLGVGIPMNLTGKNRVERINSIRNTAQNDIKFNLQPFTQYNFATNNYCPSITLRITF